MEVEYVQTVEDHLAFNAHQLASQPLWRRYWMFLAGWLVILVACGALLSAIVPARPTRALEQIWWERSLFFGFVALFSASALAGKAWSQRNQ